MHSLFEMIRPFSLSRMHQSVARGERGSAARARHAGRRPLPWKFALPLIAVASLALWLVIILAAARLFAVLF